MSALRSAALVLALLGGCSEHVAPAAPPAAPSAVDAGSACPDHFTSISGFYESASAREACRREREWEASRAHRAQVTAAYEAQRREQFGDLLRPLRVGGTCDSGYKSINGECHRTCANDRDCAPTGWCVCADGGDCTIELYAAGPGHSPFIHTQHTCFPKGRPVPVSGNFEGWTGPLLRKEFR